MCIRVPARRYVTGIIYQFANKRLLCVHEVSESVKQKVVGLNTFSGQSMPTNRIIDFGSVRQLKNLHKTLKMAKYSMWWVG